MLLVCFNDEYFFMSNKKYNQTEEYEYKGRNRKRKRDKKGWF